MNRNKGPFPVFSYTNPTIASLYLNGTSQNLSTSASMADFSLLTNDFTLDFRWKPASLSAQHTFYSNYTNANQYYKVIWQTNGFLEFNTRKISGSTGRFSVSWTPTVGSWYHIAFVRNGSTPLVFVNGISQSVIILNALGSMPSTLAGTSIGRDDNSGAFSHMYLKDYRLTNGAALWTNNFNSNQISYTTNSNTKLLLRLETNTLDTSPNPKTITNTGSAQIVQS